MRDTAATPVGRILMLIGSLGRGGTEQQLVALASGLRRRGWDVNVFSLAAGPLLHELQVGAVPVIVPRRGRSRSTSGGRIGWPHRLAFLAKAAVHLASTVFRLRPCIVHFFLPEAYLFGGPIALATGRPVRVMSRRSLNHYQRGYPRFVALLERWLHRQMTAILGNSRRVLSELNLEEHVPPQKLGLIYNGVDMTRFVTDGRQAAREQLGLHTGALALVMVANLISYKGHSDLLHALAIIGKEKLPSGWRLLLVGRDDGLKAGLQSEAVTLGIAGQITFLGERADVPNILQAGDVGILCSHEEGFSNAVLEGMAAGLAMVVTDVGGNAEAIVDGECGLLVPPHDPAALARAILRLAEDASLRQRLGAAARARVAAEFSMDACVVRHEALYRGLLAGRKPHEIPEIEINASGPREASVVGSPLAYPSEETNQGCVDTWG